MTTIFKITPQKLKSGSMKYSSEELIDEIVEMSEITCSNCKTEETTWNTGESHEYFFKKGWRKTKANIYCPTCSNKKLKSTT